MLRSRESDGGEQRHAQHSVAAAFGHMRPSASGSASLSEEDMSSFGTNLGRRMSEANRADCASDEEESDGDASDDSSIDRLGEDVPRSAQGHARVVSHTVSHAHDDDRAGNRDSDREASQSADHRQKRQKKPAARAGHSGLDGRLHPSGAPRYDALAAMEQDEQDEGEQDEGDGEGEGGTNNLPVGAAARDPSTAEHSAPKPPASSIWSTPSEFCEAKYNADGVELRGYAPMKHFVLNIDVDLLNGSGTLTFRKPCDSDDSCTKMRLRSVACLFGMLTVPQKVGGFQLGESVHKKDETQNHDRVRLYCMDPCDSSKTVPMYNLWIQTYLDADGAVCGYQLHKTVTDPLYDISSLWAKIISRNANTAATARAGTKKGLVLCARWDTQSWGDPANMWKSIADEDQLMALYRSYSGDELLAKAGCDGLNHMESMHEKGDKHVLSAMKMLNPRVNTKAWTAGLEHFRRKPALDVQTDYSKWAPFENKKERICFPQAVIDKRLVWMWRLAACDTTYLRDQSLPAVGESSIHNPILIDAFIDYSGIDNGDLGLLWITRPSTGVAAEDAAGSDEPLACPGVRRPANDPLAQRCFVAYYQGAPHDSHRNSVDYDQAASMCASMAAPQRAAGYTGGPRIQREPRQEVSDRNQRIFSMLKAWRGPAQKRLAANPHSRGDEAQRAGRVELQKRWNKLWRAYFELACDQFEKSLVEDREHWPPGTIRTIDDAFERINSNKNGSGVIANDESGQNMASYDVLGQYLGSENLFYQLTLNMGNDFMHQLAGVLKGLQPIDPNWKHMLKLLGKAGCGKSYLLENLANNRLAPVRCVRAQGESAHSGQMGNYPADGSMRVFHEDMSKSMNGTSGDMEKANAIKTRLSEQQECRMRPEKVTDEFGNTEFIEVSRTTRHTETHIGASNNKCTEGMQDEKTRDLSCHGESMKDREQIHHFRDRTEEDKEKGVGIKPEHLLRDPNTQHAFAQRRLRHVDSLATLLGALVSCTPGLEVPETGPLSRLKRDIEPYMRWRFPSTPTLQAREVDGFMADVRMFMLILSNYYVFVYGPYTDQFSDLKKIQTPDGRELRPTFRIRHLLNAAMMLKQVPESVIIAAHAKACYQSIPSSPAYHHFLVGTAKHFGWDQESLLQRPAYLEVDSCETYVHVASDVVMNTAGCSPNRDRAEGPEDAATKRCDNIKRLCASMLKSREATARHQRSYALDMADEERARLTPSACKVQPLQPYSPCSSPSFPNPTSHSHPLPSNPLVVTFRSCGRCMGR